MSKTINGIVDVLEMLPCSAQENMCNIHMKIIHRKSPYLYMDFENSMYFSLHITFY